MAFHSIQLLNNLYIKWHVTRHKALVMMAAQPSRVSSVGWLLGLDRIQTGGKHRTFWQQ